MKPKAEDMSASLGQWETRSSGSQVRQRFNANENC